MRSTAARFNPVVLRLGLGIVLFVHGLGKLGMGPTAGASSVDGLAGLIGGMLGLPVPMAFAWLVTLSEVVGGVFLAAGLFTRYVAALSAINMFVATVFVHLPNGFPAGQGGYELTLLLFLVSVALVLSGPGALSLERAAFGRELLPGPLADALGSDQGVAG